MTTTESNRQQKVRRLKELFNIARQRYLDVGGDVHSSVGTLNENDTLTDEERKEFFTLADQVFDDKYISNYLTKHGTWRERFTQMKKSDKQGEL